MESAVSKLQALFQTAEANLHYVSRKMDTEFDAAYNTATTEHLNPRRMLLRISAARQTLESLAADLALTTAQREEVMRQVEQLEREQAALMQTYGARLGLQLPAAAAAAAAAATTTMTTITTATTTSLAAANSAPAPAPAAVASAPKSAPATCKQAGRSAATFTPLSAGEYAALPAVLRKSVDLGTLNKSFSLIHAKLSAAGAAGKFLATAELESLGVPVGSSAGHSQLQALKTAGLVRLTKQGLALAYV